MKIRICSDLHLEFLPKYKYKTYQDVNDYVDKEILPINEQDEESVLVIAGDLCHYSAHNNVIRHLSERFKHVVMAFGNHDYYGTKLNHYNNITSPHNVHYSTCIIDGVNFVVYTLWSDVCRTGNQKIILNGMNDFNMIHGMSLETYQLTFENQIELIEYDLSTTHLKTVLVTHHLPLLQSKDPKYQNSMLNDAFASPCDYLLDYKSELFIHGHTHSSCDYTLGNTRVICNPFGYYVIEENENYQKELFVEI